MTTKKPEFYKSPDEVKPDIQSSPQPISQEIMNSLNDRWGNMPDDLWMRGKRFYGQTLRPRRYGLLRGG